MSYEKQGTGYDPGAVGHELLGRGMATAPSAEGLAWLKEIESKRRFLLLSSYCGDDNAECSEGRPCPDCLGMCNIFKIEEGKLVYVGMLGQPVKP